MLESMVIQMFLSLMTSFIKNPKTAFVYIDVLSHIRDGLTVVIDQLQTQK